MEINVNGGSQKLVAAVAAVAADARGGGADPADGVDDHLRDGTAVGGLLPADGDPDGIAFGRIGSDPTGGSPVHLLLRHDVDGDSSGGVGRLCQCVDRQGEHHANRSGRIPVLPRRFHSAVHVRLSAGVVVDGWNEVECVDCGEGRGATWRGGRVIEAGPGGVCALG